MRWRLLTATALGTACTPSDMPGGNDTADDDSGTPEEVGLAILGGGSHNPDGLSVTVLGDAGDGLHRPTDLEFHPDRAGELWVTNHGEQMYDESVIVYTAAGTSDQSSQQYAGSSSQHFLAKPTALAFSQNGNFATIHNTDELTQGAGATPADFMGPTLWTSDLDTFDGGHIGHIDMLHNSPLGMGIAWENDNTFWVFDGYHSAIKRYAFQADHGPGGTDHSDGELWRYAEGEVSRLDGVVSHLVYDDGMLYVADSGNGRIAVLDTATGTSDGSVGPNYDGITQLGMTGAGFTTWNDSDVETPAGMELHNGHLYVTDQAAGTVLAFDLGGTLVDWLDLERPGALAGLAFDQDGSLLVADATQNEILRVALAE